MLTGIDRKNLADIARRRFAGGIAAAMGDGVTGSLDISPGGALLSYAFDEYPPQWKIAVIPVSGGPSLAWGPAGGRGKAEKEFLQRH